jgi:hypothetical protein
MHHIFILYRNYWILGCGIEQRLLIPKAATMHVPPLYHIHNLNKIVCWSQREQQNPAYLFEFYLKFSPKLF